MAPLSSAQTLSHEEYLSQRYMPVLDVVRAVAVLSVVGFHLGEGSLNFLQGGVNVFFVLSGYLITTLALREESRRGSLDVRAFLVRRIFRILPLFYLVLGIYVVLVLGLHADDRVGDFRDALPWLFAYLQEWPVVHAGDEGLPLGVAWSLGIEEKFYVVWPFLAFVLLRGRSSRAQIAGLLATGLLLVSAFGPVIDGQLLVHYVSILVGCILAFVLHDPRGYARLGGLGRPRVLGWLLVLVAVLWLIPMPARADFVPIPDIPVFVVPVALAIGALVTALPATTMRLSPYALVRVGKLSYALYLTHQLVLNAVDRVLPAALTGVPRGLTTLVLAVPPALVLCEVLHRTVEVPMIRLGHRLGAPRPAVADRAG